MRILVVIFLGGGLGAILRYCTSEFFANNFNSIIPIGTLVVNMVGGLLIGLLLPLLLSYSFVAIEWKLFLITGFLGGLTTFSTFSYETIWLMENSPMQAMANFMLNIFGGLSMTMLGIYVSQKLI